MKKRILTLTLPPLIIIAGFFYLKSVGDKLKSEGYGVDPAAIFIGGRGKDLTETGKSLNQIRESLNTEGSVATGDFGEPAVYSTPSDSKDMDKIGSMNHEYLRSDKYSRLVVETDYVTEHAPTNLTRNQIKSTFGSYADKPGGISFFGGNEIRQKNDNYSYNDIVALWEENRSQYSGDGAATLYVIYLNGEFVENPSALGVALNATTFAVFGEKIAGAATEEVSAEEIERAVIVHEIGHLWGLVNVNYESSIDHVDPSAPNHSKNKNSVMFWANEHESVATALNDTPSYQFDSADREDIKKIKSGQY